MGFPSADPGIPQLVPAAATLNSCIVVGCSASLLEVSAVRQRRAIHTGGVGRQGGERRRASHPRWASASWVGPEVCPFGVQGACDPRCSTSRNHSAICAGVARSKSPRGSSALGGRNRSTTPFCHGLRNAVREGLMPIAFMAATTDSPNLSSRSTMR